ncbi:MAG: hypothetical protein M1825_005363 [Sarcosagium campestre]|nr:MAG: hypothetical protein M1825_005363 [Sarcosagium campestre]
MPWPPRSPHEALLGSPSGRKRLQEIREMREFIRGHVTPTRSPGKFVVPDSILKPRALQTTQCRVEDTGAGAEEDDEETLQLQLEAIQAKLKLKRLQQAKARSDPSNPDVQQNSGAIKPTVDTQSQAASVKEVKRGANKAKSRRAALRRAASPSDVQVPLTPDKRRQTAEEQRSPSRVLLGIDKGRRGRDVSLKRAPNPLDVARRSSLYISRSQSSQILGRSNDRTKTAKQVEASQQKSFNQRINEGRMDERAREDKARTLKRSRSEGFGVSEQERQGFAKAAKIVKADDKDIDPFMAEAKRARPREFTREEVLRAYKEGEVDPDPRRSKTSSVRKAPTLLRTQYVSTTTMPPLPRPSRLTKKASPPPPSADSSSVNNTRPSLSTVPTEQDSLTSVESALASEASTFEAFSSLHLSKRIIPHTFLTRTFTGKKIYTIPEILKEVKSPDYDPPDVEGDWVAMGVIASKSSPREHKTDGNPDGSSAEGNNNNNRSKYMVLTLTDLKWELDLFLFSTGFDRFWKLTPGTVVAILNPNIMPPPPARRDTGKFSLTLNSSDDTVLEIGKSRDLGFCKSVKKDGKTCDSWVDKRHTDYCTFHVDSALQKTKAGRMEVNSMSAMFAPGGRSAARSGHFSTRRPKREGNDSAAKPASGGVLRDPASHTNYFIAPGQSGIPNADRLLDFDFDSPLQRGDSNSDERLRKRLADRERERGIAAGLGRVGDGLGGEYMRVSSTATSAADGSNGDAQKPIKVNPLGLRSLRAADSVRLSPVKRRRA